MHVSTVGKVRAYDPETQTAEIQVMIQKVLPGEDPELDEDTPETPPILASVPVVHLRGGGFFAHFPVAVGDTGLLFFCDSDIGAWRATDAVSDPGTDHRHGLAGAVFLPGLFARSRSINRELAPGTLVIGREASGPLIGLTTTSISMAGTTVDCGGTNALALAEVVDAVITAILGAAGPDIGAAIKTAVTAAVGPYGNTSASAVTRGA
jgi:hypothetical protein